MKTRKVKETPKPYRGCDSPVAKRKAMLKARIGIPIADREPLKSPKKNEISRPSAKKKRVLA